MFIVAIGAGVVISVLAIILGNKFFPPGSQLIVPESSEPDLSTIAASSSITENTTDGDSIKPTENEDADTVKPVVKQDGSSDSTRSGGQPSSSMINKEKVSQRYKEIAKLYGQDTGIDDASSQLSYIKMLDWVIFLALVVALVVVTQDSWSKDFLRTVAGLFPKEFKTLGLSNYLAEPASASTAAAMSSGASPLAAYDSSEL